MLRIICVVLILLYGISYGGTIDPKKNDNEYIEYGKQHKCVLKLLGHMNDLKNTPYSASCVLINPYYALTAAHVVQDTLTQYVVNDGVVNVCLITAIHSDFNANKLGYNDIAILRLSKPIHLDFYPELFSQTDEVKKICSISGYGHTGTMSTGYNRSKDDGKKRAGSNIIHSIDKHLLICSSSDQPTSLEFIICPGDSGGGLFIDKKLAGINSCVFAEDGKTDSDYGDTSGHTRVSLFKEWIEDSVKNIENMVRTLQDKKAN